MEFVSRVFAHVKTHTKVLMTLGQNFTISHSIYSNKRLMKIVSVYLHPGAISPTAAVSAESVALQTPNIDKYFSPSAGFHHGKC